MKTCLLTFALCCTILAQAQNFITEKNEAGAFPLSIASLYVDEGDDWLVQKAASLLQSDMELVTGNKPAIVHQFTNAKDLVIIGSIEHSAAIQQLVREHKLDVSSLQGKWEAFQLQVVAKPFKGIDRALVIMGTDKRGTAYGVFELSKQMGVSPWYWWADVPVKKKKAVFVRSGAYRYGSPSVKYRGIFINDEAPAFSGWAREKFGGVNHLVYEKMFELLLRLRGNYLWPAMWGNAFNDDDTLNPILADRWGIVMGTSHHEPMLRAQQEWKRYGKGLWDYDSNGQVLRDFWKKGIEHMGRHESIVTVGMRGDGDKPMTAGTATALLERIVADQRKIITDVTGKPAASTPQLWALYKEVQDYYDKGMRVPDDVTLLLCDDNWGNIRRLPKLTDAPRSGGYGLYYHFDYVGGPRNYKWINTNNIARTWEQLNLAYSYGVNQIWIVNVGDLKPMEFPISFFLEEAWDAKKWNTDNLRDYYTQWASEQFGNRYARSIGNILRAYSQYSSRRKPELLSPDTYSDNYGEADRVVREYKTLLDSAQHINDLLPAEYKDAFFELVLHPVKALANLQQLYYAVARNRAAAAANSISANDWAARAKEFYLQDSLLSIQYNKELAGGKWSHMMDQTHIGYTYWQQPPSNRMPELKYVPANAPPDSISRAPIEIQVEKKHGRPEFHELLGYASIEAEHYSGTKTLPGITWKLIPDIGRTGAGLTVFPVTTPMQTPGGKSPQVMYDCFFYDTGHITVQAYFSPTLNIHNNDGLRYGISIDDELPQVIAINKDDNNVRAWEGWVANNIIIKTSGHRIEKTGLHVLHFWLVDAGVVLQKLVIDAGRLQKTYLGPPETINN
jgi:hypothetical protein